jgi:glutathione peroxidase-family protein
VARGKRDGGDDKMASMHDFTMNSITGDQVDLGSFENQVCLIVNVASQ